jgi:hypothetical protein
LEIERSAFTGTDLEPEAPALEVMWAEEVVSEALEVAWAEEVVSEGLAVPSWAFKVWSFLSSQSLRVGQIPMNLIPSMMDDLLHCRFEGSENLVLRIVEFIEKL